MGVASTLRICRQRSPLRTSQLRVSFCAKLPSHGFASFVRIYRHLSRGAPQCLGAFEYTSVYTVVFDALLFPRNHMADCTFLWQAMLPFWGTSFILKSHYLDHVGALKRNRICTFLN